MANDEFYEFVREALYGKKAKYEESKVEYKFDPYDAYRAWHGSFDFNRVFIKGECVNCQHYVCEIEDKVEEGPDDVVIYRGVLCPCCLKGHSVLSKEKTRPCSDFDKFPRGGV